jgi:hypothetical protein
MAACAAAGLCSSGTCESPAEPLCRACIASFLRGQKKTCMADAGQQRGQSRAVGHPQALCTAAGWPACQTGAYNWHDETWTESHGFVRLATRGSRCVFVVRGRSISIVTHCVLLGVVLGVPWLRPVQGLQLLPVCHVLQECLPSSWQVAAQAEVSQMIGSTVVALCVALPILGHMLPYLFCPGHVATVLTVL